MGGSTAAGVPPPGVLSGFFTPRAESFLPAGMLISTILAWFSPTSRDFTAEGGRFRGDGWRWGCAEKARVRADWGGEFSCSGESAKLVIQKVGLVGG
jgi:hypothetical protein